MAAAPQINTAPELYPVPLEPGSRRLEAVDILRGLLMVLMAIDHSRDYFSNVDINPTDPQHSWPALFLTRWITHLCAPGFVALAGASVYLQKRRGKSAGQLTRLLITRGLWLILLEWTVIDFGWSFGWAPFMQVIWAVGISMIGLGLMVRLPVWAIGGMGAAIVGLHNLLDPIKAASWGRYADVWRALHEQGPILYHGRMLCLMFYPALPWFGVICLGYAFGTVAAAAPERRRKIALALAGCLLGVFAALRLNNGYGDAFRFERLPTAAMTAMSFMNVQKYPPSLEYVLATFGVLLLLYGLFDLLAVRDWLPRARGVLEVFGRVPFFYYLLHIYLLHSLAVLGTMAMGLDWRFWFRPGYFFGDGLPAGWGFGLPVVYTVWLAAVIILYWPCVWFSRLKARRRDWWLSYL